MHVIKYTASDCRHTAICAGSIHTQLLFQVPNSINTNKTAKTSLDCVDAAQAFSPQCCVSTNESAKTSLVSVNAAQSLVHNAALTQTADPSFVCILIVPGCHHCPILPAGSIAEDTKMFS